MKRGEKTVGKILPFPSKRNSSVAILSNSKDSYALYPGITVIGSEKQKGQSIQLGDSQIESRHAAIRVRRTNAGTTSAEIIDLCTDAGTKIDGNFIAIGEWIALKSENLVTFGTTSIKCTFVSVDDESEVISSRVPADVNIDETDEDMEVISETQQPTSERDTVGLGENDKDDSDCVLIETDLQNSLVMSQICPVNESNVAHNGSRSIIVEASAGGSMNLQSDVTPSKFFCKALPKLRKLRSGMTSNEVSTRQRDKKQRILFTMVNVAPYKEKIKKTGHSLATSIEDATVLLTDKVYRSAKFLSAIVRGLPIVSVSWLNAFPNKLDPDIEKYLMYDPTAKDKYGFNLRGSMEDIRENGAILKDFLVVCTPSTKPRPEEVKQIVESSGGQYSDRIDDLGGRKKVGDKVLVVANVLDEQFILDAKNANEKVNIVTSEAFMLSVMRNELVLEEKYLL